MNFNINNQMNLNQVIIFQPIQILLFHGNGSNLQPIKYFHSTTPSTPSFYLSLSDIYLYSPSLSYNSRRNSVFSYNSSIYSFHHDTLDTTTTTTININIKEPDIPSSYIHSINKLRNSNKVKDKTLLFEKLSQNELNNQNYTNYPSFDSSPLFNPIIYENKSYSVSDNIKVSSKIKYLSKNYLEQIERDKYLHVSSSSLPNIKDTTTNISNTISNKRIASSKISQHQNHIDKLIEKYNN